MPLRGLATLLLAVFVAGCGSAAVNMGSGADEAKSDLFLAIEAGNVESVAAELNRDPSRLNMPEGNFQQTPLHKAARSNQLEVVQFLLENGAEVNLFDNLQLTPLAAAVAAEASPEIIALLEDYGAVD